VQTIAGTFGATAVGCLVTSPWFDFPEGHFLMVSTAILAVASSSARHQVSATIGDPPKTDHP